MEKVQGSSAYRIVPRNCWQKEGAGQAATCSSSQTELMGTWGAESSPFWWDQTPELPGDSSESCLQTQVQFVGGDPGLGGE